MYTYIQIVMLVRLCVCVCLTVPPHAALRVGSPLCPGRRVRQYTESAAMSVPCRVRLQQPAPLHAPLSDT